LGGTTLFHDTLSGGLSEHVAPPYFMPPGRLCHLVGGVTLFHVVGLSFILCGGTILFHVIPSDDL